MKLTYLKTLVTGKAKTAIAEFAYCGAMYKDALRTLERKFGQPQAAISAHLDKLSSSPPLKMHNSDNIINYSGFISSLVGVFNSLSYDSDLKSAALLNIAELKLPPNMKESWSLFTVKKHWVKPTLLDFNDWLKEKAKAHDLMKNTAFKARTEDTNNSVTRSKVASRAFAANTQHKSTLSRNRALRQHQSIVALNAKGATGCGNAVSLRKRPPRREPSLKQSSVSLVCLINTCLGNAQVPVSVRKMAPTAPITPYFMERKGFFQLNPLQTTTTSILRSRTQVLVRHLPVNSNQAKQPLCLP